MTLNNKKLDKEIEWFPSIPKIKYEGIESSNPLAFRAVRILNATFIFF